jgi:leader peptidase (prepilin peptidase) / N-methyltransferase
MPAAFGIAVVVLLGLVAGSFLNVVIARLPERMSLIRPRSRCPRCLTPIGWADNLPVLSYIVLGGRCRHCRQAIAWRYPAVELATAALFLAAYQRMGLRADLPAALLLIAGLIVITGIDLDHQIIPDVLTLPGIAVGLAASLLHPRITWLEAVLGILVGGGLFFLIILASRGGMGGGDMKLGAMLGAFLGWKLALLGAVVAMLAGGVVAVALLLAGRKGRKDAVPFGPFLALGGAVSLLWGEDLLAWYLGVFVR